MCTELYLENFISNLPDHVYWSDINSVYQGCNDQQAANFGLDKTNFVGKSVYDYADILGWNKSLADEIYFNDQQVLKSGKTLLKEEEVIWIDGNKKTYLSRKMPIKDPHGNCAGLFGISTDITSLKNCQKDLEAANQGLKLTAGSIVHEFRTPLMVINFATSILKTYLPHLFSAYQLAQKNKLSVEEISLQNFSKLGRAIKNIETAINSSNMFMNMQLLNLAQPKTVAEKMQHCSIRECVNAALEQYPLRDEEREKIIFEGKNDFVFKGDKLLATHILFNLLKNALYYLKATGKGEIIIWLESDHEENRLHFKDTAKGIPADILPHIFDQFYSKTQGGSGIGLAFCKMTMELFGGNISCHSVEGEYAEFVLSFQPFLSIQ